MTAATPITDLFEHRSGVPDVMMMERYARLVGLDEHKVRLTKMLGLLVNPAALERWAGAHHPRMNGMLSTVLRRPPLVMLAADVGSGKTELAETVGDAVARQEKIDVTLLPLSLSTRGQGRVDEMTQLLSAAFDYTVSEGTKLRSSADQLQRGVSDVERGRRLQRTIASLTPRVRARKFARSPSCFCFPVRETGPEALPADHAPRGGAFCVPRNCG